MCNEVTCTCCGEVKEKESFYKSTKYSTGIRQPCKQCIKEKGAARRADYTSCEKTIPTSKVCNACGIEKPATEFNKRSDTPTGLRSDCKDCQALKGHKHYEENAESVKSRTNSYRLTHLEDYARWKRDRRSADLESSLEKERIYRDVNKDKVLAYSRKWQKANPEKVSTASKKYYYKNRDKIKIRERAWRSKNKDKVCYYSSTRRARKKRATPPWADQEIIRDFYKEASYLNESIDHIIPLQHPLVCGLHVEFNLQAMPLKDNIRKNNNFEPCEHVLPEWFEE